MSRTVFILGAGASREAGGPLMADFLDQARQLRRDGLVKNAEADFDLVFQALAALDALHAKAKINTDNFEEIFGLFEMAVLCGRLGTARPEQIPEIAAAMRRLIVHTLEVSIRFPVRDRRVLAPLPYGDLLTLADRMAEKGLGSISYITFNYDLCLDYALLRMRRPVNYGFDYAPTNSVEVLKLHGSLNWARCAKCNRIAPWHLGEFFSRKEWSLGGGDVEDVRLYVGSRLDEFKHCETACIPEPVLVPPTWNKAAYHEVSSVWQRAAAHLSEAENIMVVGFSLPPTDDFFRYLFALGTHGDARIQRFWVIDPFDVRQRFKGLLGAAAEARFQWINHTFDAGIRDIAERLGLKGIEREVR